VSEVTHLKVSDIDSKRMCCGSSGNQKDRYVMLSAELLERLRTY
jgi:site-specific recombinase XerD